MSIDFTIAQNDLLPVLVAVLKDDNDTIVDLSGATVKFNMRARGATTTKVSAACVVSSPATDGEVTYNWQGTDTDTIGSFLGEFEVTFGSGKKLTCPNGKKIAIEVVDDLG